MGPISAAVETQKTIHSLLCQNDMRTTNNSHSLHTWMRKIQVKLRSCQYLLLKHCGRNQVGWILSDNSLVGDTVSSWVEPTEYNIIKFMIVKVCLVPYLKWGPISIWRLFRYTRFAAGFWNHHQSQFQKSLSHDDKLVINFVCDETHHNNSNPVECNQLTNIKFSSFHTFKAIGRAQLLEMKL